MIISVNRIIPVEGEGNLKAFVHLSVGDFSIQAARIIQEKDKKAWVALPQQQGKDGSWYPIIKCENAALRNEITEVVLAEWLKTQEDKSDEISRV
jgi:DNA-binding cell septation regulator SpoVG